MEVDFILCCLFMLGLTVCAGLHPLRVNCTGCLCKSQHAAQLLLDDIFNHSISKTCDNDTYRFPTCVDKENDTLICISEDNKPHAQCLSTRHVYIQTEVANHTNYTQQYDTEQCPIIITCSTSPVQQLDGKLVFGVSDCGKLKAFVSSASTNDFSMLLPSFGFKKTVSTTQSFVMLNTSSSLSLTPLSPSLTPQSLSLSLSLSTTPTSSNVVPPSLTQPTDSSKLLPSLTPLSPSLSLSLSATPTSSNVVPPSFTQPTDSSKLSSSLSLSLFTTPTSSSIVTPPPTQPTDSSSDNKKLLYIIIPTVAPLAFIVSFIITFCILNYCHKKNKKKLYIKLTSTIYSEDGNSDDSDDDDDN